METLHHPLKRTQLIILILPPPAIRRIDNRQLAVLIISLDDNNYFHVAQAGWTDPDLRFFHYRDKDKVEVDLVITKGRKIWAVEVKASQTVNRKDVRGLGRLAEHCGRDFQGGVVLYSGADSLPIGGSSFLAVPLNKIWSL